MAMPSATFLHGNLESALAKTDALIKAQPKNPYFHELRGDILMKANKAKDAADAYAKAVSLDPAKSGLLQVAYGQALMAAGDQDSLKKAVDAILSTGLERDKENVERLSLSRAGLRQLGEVPQADLATAEGYFYGGDYKDAKIFAARAQTEDEARLAGLGSRAGHHQLQVPERRNEPFAGRRRQQIRPRDRVA